MLNRMLQSVIRLKRRRDAIRYRKYLNSIAIIGCHLNESSAYNELYILKCLVNNLSKIKTNVNIGNYCNLSVSIFCNTEGKVTIGDYVYMNSGCSIRADHEIRIGSHCLFAQNVLIWDTDNHPLSRTKRHIQAEQIPYRLINSYESQGGPIVIGDDVWVCMDSLIFGGVSIGNGSIVAARSVVTKDIPEMTIVAGIPAKVIGKVPA